VKVFITSPERDTDRSAEYRSPSTPEELRKAVAEAPKLVSLFEAMPAEHPDMTYSGPLEYAPDGTYTFQLGEDQWVTVKKTGQLFWVG
jgi:hypothetical protein